MFPVEFHFVMPTMKSYYIQMGILNFIVLMQIIFLLRQLWRFKKLDKKTKWNWTLYLLIFSQISALILIWNKFIEFEKINKTEPNKG